MAGGVVTEVWEGDGKFLQQTSRKCGQHCTHQQRCSGAEGIINSSMQHPCLGFHGGGVGFCQFHLQFWKTCRTGGALVSLTRGGMWRWLLAACGSREAGCALGVQGEASPHCACAGTEKNPTLCTLLCCSCLDGAQPHGHICPNTVSTG